MKHILSIAVFLVAGALRAEPAVTVDRVQQRYPWNGMVDVDYTVSGIVNPDVYEIDLDVTDDAGGLWNAVTFLSKPGTANGSHRLTWNSAADGAQFVARKATFKLNLRQIPVATTGDYMVIDLSGGADAATYNVTYLSNVADPTNFFNTTEYKTSKLVLKRIRAGSFWMGSPETQTYRNSNEKRHYVTLTNDFYIGMFMLTGGQYNRVVGGDMPASTGEEKALLGNIGGYSALKAADGFLERLNARAFSALSPVTRFNVPTEAQWEYACRAGTETTWFFGEDETQLGLYAFFNNATPTAVGAKLPNPWCLWDMYGTAREYVYDDYEADYPDSTEESPAVEPVVYKPRYRNNFSIRGGASWNPASGCRSAVRDSTTSSTTSTSNGFRISITCHGSGGVVD